MNKSLNLMGTIINGGFGVLNIMNGNYPWAIICLGFCAMCVYELLRGQKNELE
jgi:hypothetical protein